MSSLSRIPKERTRPEPVSCRSCRSKKLKCNRVEPCSNCTARGIASESNVELLRRIERLESLLLRQTGPAETHSSHATDTPLTTTQLPLQTSSASVFATEVHSQRDEDSRVLGNIGTREDSLLSRLSNILVYRISSTKDIFEQQYPNCRSHIDHQSRIIVTFPVYSVASQLFQTYESDVDHHVNILHKPTVRSLIATVYLQICGGEYVLPGQAALLLSLFAIAAYFFKPSPNSEVATTKQSAIYLSRALSKGALDVLDYSRRNTSGTLEDLQAYILMSFVTYHLDGFSARGRVLTTTAISMVRELRLHQLDADEEMVVSGGGSNLRVLVDREVKRRVFWHIAATDWLQAFISGPQEGMYFLHPHHINVRLPKDSIDEDLILGNENLPQSGRQPTGMTFFLERVRLAHLCREMADIVPREASKLIQMPYEQIIHLDDKLLKYISNLPFFYKLDPESRRRSKVLETVYPKLPVSRYCITTEAHSRRCKLHQRFLLRPSADPRYAYSRKACLESARTVVRAYEALGENETLCTAPELLGMAVHFTHLALVVMVMGLCFNRDQADEEEIKGEVKAALQMFEDTKNPSPLLGRFLGSLRDVLQKHKVELTSPSNLATNDAVGFVREVDMLGTFTNDLGGNRIEFAQLLSDSQYPDISLDTSFEDMWQNTLQEEPHLDLVTWDSFFSALDSRPL